MKTYEQTLAYLFAQLPMYQRVGAAAYKEGLDGIVELCRRIGNPQENLKYIHVAGTNGKGSTSHMLASMLQEAGYKTGLYTSPHLVDFRERIKINGEMVSKDFVVEFTAKHAAVFEELKPSFFEMTVAMCFEWFQLQKVDYVVLETGMGGRLDSTNIITPLLSVITNIGMDHMKFLGDTEEKIAWEKAGIIKPGIPVLIGESNAQTRPVFEQKAAENQAPIYWAEEAAHCEKAEDDCFNLKTGTGQWMHLYTPLTGEYQTKNIQCVFAAYELLQTQIPGLTEAHFRLGLTNVLTNTGLRGRWEKLQSKPDLICDIGHNAHGFKEILKSIERHPHKDLYMVLGFVNDKDLGPVLSQLPQTACYIFTRSSSERSIPAAELAAEAKQYGLNGQVIEPVTEAVKQALNQANTADLVYLGGSTFVVADYLSRLETENK